MKCPKCQFNNAEDASILADALNDIYFKSFANCHHGAALYYKGSYDEAERYLLEGFGVSEKIANVAVACWTAHHLAIMYFDMGEYKKLRIITIKQFR